MVTISVVRKVALVAMEIAGNHGDDIVKDKLLDVSVVTCDGEYEENLKAFSGRNPKPCYHYR